VRTIATTNAKIRLVRGFPRGAPATRAKAIHGTNAIRSDSRFIILLKFDALNDNVFEIQLVPDCLSEDRKCPRDLR
jgi:hypothetical protein